MREGVSNFSTMTRVSCAHPLYCKGIVGCVPVSRLEHDCHLIQGSSSPSPISYVKQDMLKVMVEHVQ